MESPAAAPAGPRAPRFDGAVRLSVVYALIFAGTGVSLPFITPWFSAHGLTGAEIGVLLGAPMLARVVTSPLIAVWADSFRLRRTALAILAAVAMAGYAGVGLTRGLGPWLLLWLIGQTAAASMIPLTDVLCLRRARREGFAFGGPRGMGSLAFIVANVAMGGLMAAYGVDLVIIWIALAAGLAALASALVLPPEPVHEDGPVSRAERFKGLGRLMADPLFLTAILSIGLIQATHAFLYAFATVSWKAQGISDGMVGLLWGAGVAAEIVFLWFLEPWRRRMGAWNLLILAAVAGVVRWTAMAFAPPLWLLWPLQVLHALTFAAGFVGGLQIVERLSPPESVSAAQTLSSALSSGVLIGAATMISGALFDRYGAGGYLAMSVLSLAGLAGVVMLKRRVG
jgi:PPP family 3-phenylpropionic acid transporter